MSESVCSSLVVEPSTSVPVTVIVVPTVETVLMPAPAMVNEPPLFERVTVLVATDKVCSSFVLLRSPVFEMVNTPAVELTLMPVPAEMPTTGKVTEFPPEIDSVCPTKDRVCASVSVPVMVMLPPFVDVDSVIDKDPATLIVTGLPPLVLVVMVELVLAPAPTPKIPSFVADKSPVLLIVHCPDELETPMPVPAMRFHTGSVTDEYGTPSLLSDACKTPETMRKVSMRCNSLVNEVSIAEMVSPEITMPGPAT